MSKRQRPVEQAQLRVSYDGDNESSDPWVMREAGRLARLMTGDLVASGLLPSEDPEDHGRFEMMLGDLAGDPGRWTSMARATLFQRLLLWVEKRQPETVAAVRYAKNRTRQSQGGRDGARVRKLKGTSGKPGEKAAEILAAAAKMPPARDRAERISERVDCSVEYVRRVLRRNGM